MAYYIDQKECVLCGSCLGSCPYGAILKEKGIYKIDQEKCTLCEACLEACPVGAIKFQDSQEVV